MAWLIQFRGAEREGEGEMSVEELEDIAECVKTYFLNQIMTLSNNEVEVVLEHLEQYISESLERVRAANH